MKCFFALTARGFCGGLAIILFLAAHSQASSTSYGHGHSSPPGWFETGSTPISEGLPVRAQVGVSAQLDPSDAFELKAKGPYFYIWELVERPSGSAAQLDDPGALRPSLSPDVPGEYVAELTVGIASRRSGRVWLHEADRLLSERFRTLQKVRVRVSTVNVPPVAQIKFLGEAKVGGTAELSGVSSFDGDGDPISYAWRILSAPPGSQVDGELSDQAQSPEVTLVPDAYGSYELELVVTDSRGNPSSPERLRFKANAGVAPVASGLWQQIEGSVGKETILDAFSSTDADGDRISASWRLVYGPTGSTAKLRGRSDRRVKLAPDVPGDYLIQVRVEDKFGKASTDHVLVVAKPTENIRPIAKIAPLPLAQLDDRIKLDATQSYDFDGDSLEYLWSILSSPENSTATVEGGGPIVGFTPDLTGTYILQLITSDSRSDSIPATIIVSTERVRPVADPGLDQVPASDGSAFLDGLGSDNLGGDALSYDWSILGLAGSHGANGAELSDKDTANPTLMLGRQTVPFFSAVKTMTVYRNRAGAGHGHSDDLCHLDIRPAPLLTAEESPDHPYRPRLFARGLVWDEQGRKRQVWTIKNSYRGANRSIRLQSADGAWFEAFDLPGGVNATLSAPHNAHVPAKLFVDGVFRGAVFGRHQSFTRHDPICSGAAASVVQLQVENSAGTSLPATTVVGDGNLRPVVRPRTTIGGSAAAMLTLVGDSFAFDANSDDVSYRWSLIYRPEGSLAEIDGGPLLAAEQIDLTTDRAGIYLVQLNASDGDLEAVPAVIVVDVSNESPTADAGPDQQVFVGETAIFKGVASSDPDGDPLTFSWSLIARPAGSSAVLAGTTSSAPSLQPDRRGTYAVQLIVSDGVRSSAPDVATLIAPNRLPSAVLALVDEGFVGEITTLDASQSTDPDNDPLSLSMGDFVGSVRINGNAGRANQFHAKFHP